MLVSHNGLTATRSFVLAPALCDIVFCLHLFQGSNLRLLKSCNCVVPHQVTKDLPPQGIGGKSVSVGLDKP